MLNRENKVVRVTQLSSALGVRKSSVSAALTKLSKEGLVIHEKYGFVELTAEGEKIANDVLRRHEILEQFLGEILGVNAKIAWNDACDMEHYISPVTIQKLTMFVEFVLSKSSTNYSGLFQWLDSNIKRDKSSKDMLTISNMVDEKISLLED